jgi:hypothetical protein
VEIESSFRAHPTWCSELPSLFQSGAAGPEQYDLDPDDPNAILQGRDDVESGGEAQERLKAYELSQSKNVPLTITGSRCRSGPDRILCIYHYRLATGWIMTDSHHYTDDEIKDGKVPPVDFEDYYVPIVGRYEVDGQ